MSTYEESLAAAQAMQAASAVASKAAAQRYTDNMGFVDIARIGGVCAARRARDADVSAGGGTSETVVGVVGGAGGPVSMAYALFTPAAALTADANNFAVFWLAVHINGASVATPLASLDTRPATPVRAPWSPFLYDTTTFPQPKYGGSTGSWVQWTPLGIPAADGSVAASGAYARLSAGDVITYGVTKVGAGVVVPAGMIEVYLRVGA